MERILKKDEKLVDEVFNKPINIICKGNNLIKNCIFSKCEGNVINIKGFNTIIKDNVFQEIIDKNCVIIDNKGINTIIENNLFIQGVGKVIIGNNMEIKLNRIENWNDNEIMILDNTNKLLGNEFINNKGIMNILNNNLIKNNIFDNKNHKKGLQINILGKYNDFTVNNFRNIDKCFILHNVKQTFCENNFENIKLLFNIQKDTVEKYYVNNELTFTNNNGINIEKKFNLKAYNGVFMTINFSNKEIDMFFRFNELKNNKIKYIEKEIKKEKEEDNSKCCCKKLSKMIQINQLLSEYKETNNKMKKLIQKINKLVIDI